MVQPSFETLRELLRACGFDLEATLVPYEANRPRDERLEQALKQTPQERLQAMLEARAR